MADGRWVAHMGAAFVVGLTLASGAQAVAKCGYLALNQALELETTPVEVRWPDDAELLVWDEGDQFRITLSVDGGPYFDSDAHPEVP